VYSDTFVTENIENCFHIFNKAERSSLFVIRLFSILFACFRVLFRIKVCMNKINDG